MLKKSRLISLICSAIVGVVFLLAIMMILIFRGVLNIEAEKLVITSQSCTATYTGRPISDDSWDLLDGKVKDGHKLSVKVSGSQTNVGSSENYIFATITDELGADVTDEYNIEYRPGVLKVKPRPISVIAESASKMFDGEPLSIDGYKLEPALALASGESIEVTVAGERTEIGESENVVTEVIIKNQKGEETTFNYDITPVSGRLVVYGLDALVFKSESSECFYNGKPLVNKQWSLIAGALEEGHTADVTVSGRQEGVGQSENFIEAVIYDSLGNDVTSLYDVKYEVGTLIVNKQPLTVTSADAQKVYDGEPLTKKDGYILDPSYVQSDGIQVHVDIRGTITDIGETSNTIWSITVINADGEDITGNYDIYRAEGTLRVVANEDELKGRIVFASDSATKVYDRTPLTCENWQILEGELQPGHSVNIVFTGSRTDVGKSDNSFEAVILDSAKNNVSDKYQIERIYGTLEVTPKPITIIAGSAEKGYDGQPLTSSEFSCVPIDAMDGGLEFIVETIGSQTEVGSSENTVGMVTIIDEFGRDITANFDITRQKGCLTVYSTLSKTPHKLVFSSDDADKFHDGHPLREPNWHLLSGSIKNNHSLSVTVDESITEVGRTDNTIKVTITDEFGNDVTDEYSIELHPGTLEVFKKEIVVKSSSAEKAYDGTPLTSPDYYVMPTVEGYNVVAEIIGSQTELGSSKNIISKVYVYDPLGNDVTVDFEIKREEGELLVLPEEKLKTKLVITSDSAEKIYDGSPLFCHSYTITEGELQGLHSLIVTFSAEITDIGEVINSFDAEIYDELGKNVSDEYLIDCIPGVLTVKKRALEITTSGAWKYYDGEPLVLDEYSYGPYDALLPYHTLSVTVVGSQTGVGSSKNAVSSRYVYDSLGNDVTDNYDITVNEGILEVRAVRITAESPDARKEYDGTPLTNSDARQTSGALLDGHRILFNVTGQQTDVGESLNYFSLVILDSNDVDVSLFYDVELIEGTLVVDKATVTVVSGSAEKTFDGTALMCETLIISPETFETGGFIFDNFFAYGERTAVGASPNYISLGTIYSPDGRDVTEFFNIIKDMGTLTVTEEPKTALIYKSHSMSKPYDGTPLEFNSFELLEGALNESGHYAEAHFTASITDVGKTENTFTVTIYNREREDVTDEYVIDYVYGVLEVRPLTVILEADSAEKVYDGTPLSAGFSYSAVGTLPEGVSIYAETVGSRTDVGESTNAVVRGSFQATDALGNDITDMLEVEYVDGTLSVTPAKIKISTKDAAKEYDGAPLTNSEYDVTWSTPVLDFANITVKVTGELTEVGQADNTFGYGITDGEGNDISSNFVVSKDMGKLEVFENAGGSDDGPVDDNRLWFTVESNVADQIYLKQMSYGGYFNGRDFASAPVYSGTMGGYSPAFITSMALADSGYRTNKLKITPNGLYALPYYAAGDVMNTQTSDSEWVGDGFSPYEVDYYKWDAYSGIIFPETPELIADFAAYERFVEENYLYIDSETEEFMQQIMREQRFYGSDANIIEKVANYIQNESATYNLKYDKSLDSEDNVVISFLSDYKEGVCRHYAMAATMLYRALGIPARYTVGFMANVKANVPYEIRGAGHAWVEVFVYGIGWVNVEVTGSDGSGSVDSNAKILKATPAGVSKKYDGTTLYASQSVVFDSKYPFTKYASQGYTYEVVVEGERTEPGKSQSRITKMVIYDPLGNDVTDEFDIDIDTPGTVHVYIEELVFASNGGNKIYDGKALNTTLDDCYLVSGGLGAGLDYILTPDGSITNAGTKNATFGVSIVDEYGSTVNEDGVKYNDCYKITKRYGTLTVETRKITISAASATASFGELLGAALTAPKIEYDEAQLAEGDRIAQFSVSGAQTNIGRSENLLDFNSIKIVNEKGEDVTNNYTITCENGVLKVTP